MNILDKYLYTGGDDRRIKIWDISKDCNKINKNLFIKIYEINIKKKVANVEDLNGHEDGVISLEFADGMLYSGSFDHLILSWDLKEMYNRIRERFRMFCEDVSSRKY